MLRTAHSMGILAKAAVIGLALAACGTSSSTSSTSSTSGGAASSSSSAGPATGTPIKVAATCLETPPVVQPECYTEQQAFFTRLNASGGVNNHPIQFEHCDASLARAENLAQCLRKFAGEPDLVALVGGTGDRGWAAALPNMPNIGVSSTAVDDLAAPTSFPISAFTQGGALDFIASARYISTAGGGTSPGLIFVDIPSSPTAALSAYFQGQGQTLSTISVPLSQADFTPIVATAKSRNADPLLISHSTTAIGKMLQAMKQLNYNTHPIVVYACYDARLLATLGSSGNGVSCSNPYKPWDVDGAGDDLKALMDKYGPSDWKFGYNAVNAYVADKLLVQALKGIKGDVTPASVITAMKGITAFTDSFISTPIDFSKPGPSTKYPAIRDAHFYTYIIQDGKLTLPTHSAADMMQYLPKS